MIQSVTVCFKNVIWTLKKLIFFSSTVFQFQFLENFESLICINWSFCDPVEMIFILCCFVDSLCEGDSYYMDENLSYQFTQSLLHISLSEMEKLSDDKIDMNNNQLGWSVWSVHSYIFDINYVFS